MQFRIRDIHSFAANGIKTINRYVRELTGKTGKVFQDTQGRRQDHRNQHSRDSERHPQGSARRRCQLQGSERLLRQGEGHGDGTECPHCRQASADDGQDRPRRACFLHGQQFTGHQHQRQSGNRPGGRSERFRKDHFLRETCRKHQEQARDEGPAGSL